MDIHEEKRLGDIKDGQLWNKMLSFARPYWKQILWSFILAVLIVGALIVQPLFIQIAIDDRINGLYKPMVSIPEHASAEISQDFSIADSVVIWDHTAFYRVEGDGMWPSSAIPVQIVLNQGEHYLVYGWHGDGDELILPQQHESTFTIQHEGEQLSVRHLSADELDLFRKQDYTGFLIIALLFLLSVVLAGALTYWQSILLQNTGQQIIYDIRKKMFHHLTKLQTSYFDRNPVGRLVTRVAHDVEALNQMYSQVLVNLAKELLMLAGIVGVMLYMDVELALVTFAVVPFLVLATFLFKGAIREAQRNARAMLSKLNSFLAENLSGMGIVQIFTREKKQLSDFNELNEAHYKAGMRGTTLNSIFNPTIGFIGNLALALIVWYGGKAVLNMQINYGIVYAFTVYARQFFTPLMALSDRYTQIQTALASAERIFELLDEQPKILNKADAKVLPEPIRGEIVFDRVWFAYDRDEWVLRNISFTAKPGETVAFVGATGAGKSSIINLINRFYDVQQGSVRIDGIDLRDLKIENVRQHVGVIQQDPFVFTGNVYDNIRLNRKNVSEEEIRMAAKALSMDDFIRRLPKQYDTPLGEQGIRLSSGQQQLLSFLRAYVDNPNILILDEATAHVDTETEKIVQEGLIRLSQGRTTLIVAHRLSTIRHADKIIVMHKGQIREIGNHDELMRQGGIYRKLYELQNTERQVEHEVKPAQ